jgi:hypothetical protein
MAAKRSFATIERLPSKRWRVKYTGPDAPARTLSAPGCSPKPGSSSSAELMARLGHSTPQAALRYQHVAQGRDREIASLLSKLADTRVSEPPRIP